MRGPALHPSREELHFINIPALSELGSHPTELPKGLNYSRANALGTQNEVGQRLIDCCQENTLVIANTLSNNPRDDSTHGHHQMLNTEIRLIIFFAAKDGEALNSQQKQDLELTVAQVMNSLLPNSDLN